MARAAVRVADMARADMARVVVRVVVRVRVINGGGKGS
jgi:hypothetical protein